MATRRSSRVTAAKAPAPAPAKAPAPKSKKAPKRSKGASTASIRQGLGGSAAPKTSAPLGVVDPASGLEEDGVIYSEEDGTVYDVMLNMLDLSQNMDKYYILQLIHNEDTDEYVCYARWGRTGTSGQKQQWPMATAAEALEIFEEKFKEKTGHDWDDRANYAHIPGKYKWLKMDHVARGKKLDAVWQYYIEDNTQGKKNGWYDYDPENSVAVEQLHDQYLYNQEMSQRVLHSETSGYDYLVDLAAMKQTNQSSGKVRDIRRSKPIKKEDEEEEDEDEAMAPATPAKGRKRAVKQEEEEDDEDEEEAPTPKKKKAAAAPARGRKRAAAKEEDDEDDADEDEEEEEAPKKGRAAKKQKTAAPKAPATPPAKAKKGKAAAAAPAAAKTRVSGAKVNANSAAQVMGTGAVDPACPYAGSGSLEPGFDCMLNQVDIKDNKNKFYLLQLVEVNGQYYLWTRWGRVGEAGQTQAQGPMDLEDGEKAFAKKFRDKTGNSWDDRDNFEPRPGKYELVELDPEGAAGGSGPSGSAAPAKKKRTSFPPCKLDPTTREFVEMIFDEDMFKESLASLKLDINKMPLGRLGQAQLDRGMAVLEELEDAIKSNSRMNVLQDLSSKFYQVIPHAFGRGTRPPVMSSLAQVQEKYDLLNVLGDVETAKVMAEEADESELHPLDEKYEKLHATLDLVPAGSHEYKMIETYTEATKKQQVKLLHAWRVDRHHESNRFAAHSHLSNRKLLWHGTNVAVVAAILKSGLRIMPHSGGRVGKGIYLASENGKSSCYTWPAQRGGKRVGVMFLVEAALGKEHHITRDNSSLTRAPPGFDSIVAKGHNEPDPTKDTSIKLDGLDVTVPQGKPIPFPEFASSSFDQSEYLLYQESQHRIRYVLALQF